MCRYRLLIVCLTFFFSLVGSLNAFCVLENEAPAKSTSQIRSSISCLGDEENPFLAQVYQGQKKIYFSKVEKRAMNASRVAFLRAELSSPTLLQPSGAIFAPFSIPIHQFNTVYRI